MGNAESGKPLKTGQDLPGMLTLRPRIEPGNDGLADVVVVPADVIAVPAQYVQLVLELGGVADVAGVSVLGDQPESLLLAPAGDQDRRMGAGQ